MSEWDRETSNPPPPEQRDLDAEHRGLIELLANHPDPKVRVLAHISTRQFELSERLSDMQRSMTTGFSELTREMRDGFIGLKDKVDALDEGFKEVEERTEDLEDHVRGHSLNGSSSPTQ